MELLGQMSHMQIAKAPLVLQVSLEDMEMDTG